MHFRISNSNMLFWLRATGRSMFDNHAHTSISYGKTNWTNQHFFYLAATVPKWPGGEEKFMKFICGGLKRSFGQNSMPHWPELFKGSVEKSSSLITNHADKNIFHCCSFYPTRITWKIGRSHFQLEWDLITPKELLKNKATTKRR